MKKQILPISLLTVTVLMLPGCKGWMGSNSADSAQEQSAQDSSITLVVADGKPLVTQNMFNQKVEQLLAARPGMREQLERLPAEQQVAFYNQMIDAIVAEELAKRFVDDAGLTQTSDFKQARAEAMKMVDAQLRSQMFVNEITQQVQAGISDDVARAYYQENRSRNPMFKRAPFLESAGGVATQVIEGFATKQEADAVFPYTKTLAFERVARDAKKQVKDLGTVSARSYEVEDAVRKVVADIKTFPHFAVVKMANGRFAIVKAVALKEDQYAAYENPQVREAVRGFMINQEAQKAMQQKLEELKSKYAVTLNQEAIARLVKAPAGQDFVPVAEQSASAQVATAVKAA